MIAQADSRKWMACLYNSFLFMEAKIMKMAKKVLALVLTGVMAVSMLTGCALSDKIKENAIVDALEGYYQAEKGKDVKFEQVSTSAIKAEAKKVTDAISAAKTAGTVTTEGAVPAGVTIDTHYSAVVVAAPKNATKQDTWNKLVKSKIADVVTSSGIYFDGTTSLKAKLYITTVNGLITDTTASSGKKNQEFYVIVFAKDATSYAVH